MYRKFIYLCFCSVVLISCNENPKNFLKRSANNKLLDTEGFQGDKRRPLYNSKYISQAKKNIALDQEECDDEESECSELKVPTKVYKHMYMEMLADEYNRKKERLKDYAPNNDMSLQRADRRVRNVQTPDNKSLQQEIAEIKTLLKQTKSELANYKCKPDAIKQELEDVRNLSPNGKHTSELIVNRREEVLSPVVPPRALPPVHPITPRQNNILQRKFLREEEKKSPSLPKIYSTEQNIPTDDTVRVPAPDEPIIQRKFMSPEDYHNI